MESLSNARRPQHAIVAFRRASAAPAARASRDAEELLKVYEAGQPFLAHCRSYVARGAGSHRTVFLRWELCFGSLRRAYVESHRDTSKLSMKRAQIQFKAC